METPIEEVSDGPQRSPTRTAQEELSSTRAGSPPLPPRHEGELLEQVHVLLVLEEGAVQRRDELPRIALAQLLGTDVLGEQELEPIEELGGRGFLPQARDLADLEEDAQALLNETALDAGVMHLDDAVHRLGVGEPDVVEEAAAQERIRQLLLVVRGDEHDRASFRAHRLAGLVDVELHAVELEQEVVRELDVGLVDLVDEEHRARLSREGVPELAAADVVADVGYAGVAELTVAEARDGVVLVEPLLRLRGRLDVPGQERRAERLRNLLGEHGLAGAGLALHEQRPLEDDRGLDRDLQILGSDVGFGAVEAHAAMFLEECGAT